MNKYRNKKTMYNDVLYDSMREATYARELDLRVKAKDIMAWSGQPKFPILVNGKKICTYIADFKVINNDGSVEYVDTKGYETSIFKLKFKLIKALFPEINFKIVK